MKNILVISGDQPWRRAIAAILESQGAFLNVHTAATARRAFHLLETIPVDLAITTLRSPRFGRLRLVGKLAEKYPSLKIIVMARNRDSLKEQVINRYQSAIFIDQAGDLGLLVRRLYSELRIDHGGHVRGLALASLLQMMEAENRTATLRVSSKNHSGLLWIKNGDLIAARSPSGEGKDAALEIVSWDNSAVDIDYAPHDAAPQFSMPLMMLFMESGQKYDEILHDIPYERRHDRFGMDLATEYRVRNKTRQCVLHDISLSGVYLETDQTLAVGESIVLALPSPVSDDTCVIEAEIIHKDATGAGARFTIADSEQQRILQEIIDSRMDSSWQGERESSTPPA
ncbi:MAG: PilZ domain-containing protein [Desulfofustis sp.]|nr:PilZ domain-containing protein [Desulfofustis sp.]